MLDFPLEITFSITEENIVLWEYKRAHFTADRHSRIVQAALERNVPLCRRWRRRWFSRGSDDAGGAISRVSLFRRYYL